MQQTGALDDTHHLEKFDKITFDRLCNDYGIVCLTPNVLNMLMWSYYGDSHRGFCIGYNAKYLVSSGLFGMGGKVIYRDDFPTVPLFWDENDHPMLNTLFTKWTKWQHENEYRLIHKYKRGKIYSLPEEAIIEIVLGSEISDKERFSLMGDIRRSLPNTSIYQIELRKSSFDLMKVPVFVPNDKQV